VVAILNKTCRYGEGKMLSASWYKIIALSALQGAISLTWLIYNIYLPQLLISYGFEPGLAVLLIIIENSISVILEPLFGSLSDRAFRWVATKFGFVALGVILTSALTVLIPTIFIYRDIFSAVRWIMPAVLIAWAMAMSLFRTPAISLIGRYASASDLPLAMSFLTLVGGFIGALKPISQNFLLGLGAPLTFTTASIVLLIATALLRYFDPPTTPDLSTAKPEQISLMKVFLSIGMGLGISWASRCLFETIPKVIKLNFPQLNPVLLMLVISLAITLSAISSGTFAVKYGNQKAMFIGVGTTAIALLLMVFIPTTFSVTISILAIVCCFSLMTNGAIPLAIDLFPAHRAGLAVGLYFSGFTAGISSFSALFNPVSNLTPSLGALYGSIGAIIAGGCVWQSLKFSEISAE
jgi:MFS family permease